MPHILTSSRQSSIWAELKKVKPDSLTNQAIGNKHYKQELMIFGVTKAYELRR